MAVTHKAVVTQLRTYGHGLHAFSDVHVSTPLCGPLGYKLSHRWSAVTCKRCLARKHKRGKR